MTLLALAMAWYVIYRIVRKRLCRKHGHIWIQRRRDLKCKRCKRKMRAVTVVKPESRELR